uniref:ubiquitinyl hydrolase 1 n=1 Tax=Chromera velia CCMP2878 TaxID=1169474 RepID=A0A0G4HZT7_9ALVE|eukprot:Cvel_9765.t1-p1 / transcript=Cvel_9765.t1 / gene=Cvel_9765 / organism=Chromera_velia_CCMP2878 / gene_product=hypothetical protein / transcript_product=hypothetical protein / location=Cvel_scaffold572:21871-27733(+) / protein_length=1018 / sequence_SO=supercontig / SO=protein_coding / is_pseudo=false
MQVLEWNCRLKKEQEAFLGRLPPGLPNPRYNCYVNALLQALASLPEFCASVQSLFGEDKRVVQCSSGPAESRSSRFPSRSAVAESGVLKVLSCVLQFLNNNCSKEGSRGTQGNGRWSVSELRPLLGPLAFSNDEEDAYEALHLLLSALEETVTEMGGQGGAEAGEERGTAREKEHEKDEDKALWYETEKGLPLPHELFQGTLSSFRLCTQCGLQSRPVESLFVDLPLHIPHQSPFFPGPSPDVGKLLETMSAPELVEGVVCVLCSLRVAARTLRCRAEATERALRSLIALSRPCDEQSRSSAASEGPAPAPAAVTPLLDQAGVGVCPLLTPPLRSGLLVEAAHARAQECRVNVMIAEAERAGGLRCEGKQQRGTWSGSDGCESKEKDPLDFDLLCEALPVLEGFAVRTRQERSVRVVKWPRILCLSLRRQTSVAFPSPLWQGPPSSSSADSGERGSGSPWGGGGKGGFHGKNRAHVRFSSALTIVVGKGGHRSNAFAPVRQEEKEGGLGLCSDHGEGLEETLSVESVHPREGGRYGRETGDDGGEKSLEEVASKRDDISGGPERGGTNGGEKGEKGERSLSGEIPDPPSLSVSSARCKDESTAVSIEGDGQSRNSVERRSNERLQQEDVAVCSEVKQSHLKGGREGSKAMELSPQSNVEKSSNRKRRKQEKKVHPTPQTKCLSEKGSARLGVEKVVEAGEEGKELYVETEEAPSREMGGAEEEGEEGGERGNRTAKTHATHPDQEKRGNCLSSSVTHSLQEAESHQTLKLTHPVPPSQGDTGAPASLSLAGPSTPSLHLSPPSRPSSSSPRSRPPRRFTGIDSGGAGRHAGLRTSPFLQHPSLHAAGGGGHDGSLSRGTGEGGSEGAAGNWSSLCVDIEGAAAAEREIRRRPRGTVEGNRRTNRQACTYGLRAVIEHQGTTNAGHFVCFRKWDLSSWRLPGPSPPSPSVLGKAFREFGSFFGSSCVAENAGERERGHRIGTGWLLTSDEVVCRVPPQAVEASQAYLLFYAMEAFQGAS